MEKAMHDALLRLIPWGIEIISAIQSWAVLSGAWRYLDPAFRAITALGDEYFFLLLMPFLFFCIDKRHGARLAFLCLTSTYLNSLLKHLFRIPRPFDLSTEIIHAKVAASGYAFPSNHAQSAATIWPSLALTFRRRWLTALSVVLVALISFSRVYLGVHYPQDVIAGIMIGLLYVAIYFSLEPPIEAWLGRQQLSTRLALAIALSMLMAIILPVRDGFLVAASMMGLAVGYTLERRWLDSAPRPGLPLGVGRLVVGMVVLGTMYWGLRGLSPQRGTSLVVGMFCVIRYTSVGLGATLLCPWLFLKLNLAERRAP